MLDNMAVPYIQAGDVELGLDPGHLAGQGDNGILVACFIRLCRGNRSGHRQQGDRVQILPVDHFVADQVQVDRVGIDGGIKYFPDFDAVQLRKLGDCITPFQVLGEQVAGKRIDRHDAEPRLARSHGIDQVAGGKRRCYQAVRQKGRISRGPGKEGGDYPGVGVDLDADLIGHQFVKGHHAGIGFSAKGSFSREHQVLRQGRGCVGRLCQGNIDDKIHHLTGGEGIGGNVRKSAEGAVGRGVEDADAGAVCHAAEIDDYVGAFSRSQQQGLGWMRSRNGGRNRAVAGKRGNQSGLDPDNIGKKSLIAADLVERHFRPFYVINRAENAVGSGAGDDEHGEVEGARVAAVQQAQTITGRCYIQLRPGRAVDDHGVEKGFRVPDSGNVGKLTRQHGADVRPGKGVKEGTAGRIKERAVGVEGAVLDRDRDLADACPGYCVKVRVAAGN